MKQEFTTAGSSASFTGIIYSPDGRKVYASQANSRVVVADVAPDGTLRLNRFITGFPLSTASFPGREDGAPYPGVLALSADGNILYVVLNRNNSLAVVDLRGDRVVAEIPVGNAPHAVVVWREVPLNELNPALARLTGVQLEWALACEKMDFSAPDAADEDLLNRAIWYGTKGFDVPYPGDGRVLRPNEVEAHVEALRSRAQTRKTS